MTRTYKIVRHFQRHPDKTIGTGFTRDQATQHCNNPEASSTSCTSIVGVTLTKNFGPWFDGFYEEESESED